MEQAHVGRHRCCTRTGHDAGHAEASQVLFHVLDFCLTAVIPKPSPRLKGPNQFCNPVSLDEDGLPALRIGGHGLWC